MNAKPYKSTPMPTSTPWGAPDFCEQIAPGWWRVNTPGHGGFLLSPERLAAIPELALEHSFNGAGFHGVFEEDCDWCIPVLAFQADYRAYLEREGEPAERADEIIGIAKATLDYSILRDSTETYDSLFTQGATA